jgi:glycosyltransferase involved in cell wall biosynthesis
VKRLRVLDLGASDGHVTAWAAREHPGPITVDALDADANAVAFCNARIRRLRRKTKGRVDGRAKVGLAEDAPRLFEAGTYDAVILFELIEHVPDPASLLGVAERMLAPGGRIYVSTPDGAFGDGHNPHHLRAYRAIDLADELRRRGTLLDMGVGEDTVTFGSYQPVQRVGTATIYTGPGWQKWSPNDPERKGLGGSETAAIRLASALSDLGWVVTVYGDVEECVHRDVIYRHHAVFDPLAPVDLLISSRVPEVFDRPARARRRMLWLHDTDCGDRLTPARAARIDDVLVLSAWHEGHVRGMYPFLDGKIRRIRNGIDLDRFSGPELARQPRVLYTSSPDRGLDLLLRWWPTIRRQAEKAGVPFAELAACYSPVYWRIAAQDHTVGQHAAEVRRLADQPGVELLESQSQPALARLMRESLVWCAPSYNTPHGIPFHETSCIGAMEAQAAGCVVVASAWGALRETVKVGALVQGDPASAGWREAFIAEVVRGLTDPDQQRYAQLHGPPAASELGWDGVAREVSDLAALGVLAAA